MYRPQHVLHGTLILASLLMVSCGSSDPASPTPTPARTEKNGAPVTIAEGESANVDVPELANQTVTVQDAASLNVDVAGGRPIIRAPYGSPATSTVILHGVSDTNETILKIPVTVTAASWHPTSTWTDGPEAREHGAVVRDDTNKRVIVIGGSGYKPYGTPLGDVWAWSLAEKKWSKPAVEGDVPTPAGSRRVAMDGASAYLFGGYADGSAVNDELIRVELGNPIKFKKLTHTGAIPPRSLHAFVKARDGFVVFGGASTKPWNDTWTLTIAGDVGTFAKVNTPVAPTGRYGFFYGADAERLIVWSGAQSFSTVKPAQDTWAFDFATSEWTQIAVDDPSAPKGRRNGCFVYDNTFKRLFVFGGTADAMTSESGLYVLDARVGKETWAKVDRPGEPALRSSGFGFFDPASRAATCGFGNTTSAVYADWTSFGP